MEPVRVEVEETEDLLEALSVRGLSARLARDGEAVEVAPPPGEESLWNLEIVSALEAWLAETQRPELVARVGGHRFTVRAPRTAPSRRAEPSPEPAPRRRPRPEVLAAALLALLLVATAVWFLVSALAR